MEGQIPRIRRAVPESASSRLFIPFTAFGPLAEWEAMPSRPADDDDEEDTSVAQLRASCERFQLDAIPLQVVRDAEHIDQCQRLLSEAKECCVIHSAFWSEAGIGQYADQIRVALRNGVRIFLCVAWGSRKFPQRRNGSRSLSSCVPRRRRQKANYTSVLRRTTRTPSSLSPMVALRLFPALTSSKPPGKIGS